MILSGIIFNNGIATIEPIIVNPTMIHYVYRALLDYNLGDGSGMKEHEVLSIVFNEASPLERWSPDIEDCVFVILEDWGAIAAAIAMLENKQGFSDDRPFQVPYFKNREGTTLMETSTLDKEPAGSIHYL